MQEQHDRPSGHDALAFLSGGGEMGTLIRAFDWSHTPLGPIESWPGSLRTTVSICLASDLPICIIWGVGLVQIYNDGYRAICGGKHPRSLGQNFPECWREAWPVIGDAHDSALAGDTAFLETQRIFLDRYGYTEECFFTFSFSPIRDEAGRVGGLFHPVIEMTAKMQGERRTHALRDVASRTANSTTVDEACALAAHAMASHDRDVPFALIYLFDAHDKSARLAASIGLSDTDLANIASVTSDGSSQASWTLSEVQRTGETQTIDDLETRFGILACGPYPEGPRTALALALKAPGSERPVGVLVAGVSSRLRLSQGYRDFHELLAATVSTAVTNGRAFEDERRKAEALAELDRTKTAFFSNVSHEFRTPLTLMLGPVEDMLAHSQTDLSPAAKSQLEVVNRNGMRLLRLVNTLLDFSRIEAGRVRAAFQPTNLTTFTTELASVFRSACERAGLVLTVECEPLGEPVFVDRDMWEKVVLNLLSNAFKFTFAGEIAVTLRKVGNAAELRIRDSGTGIPSSEMPRLFERFHRVENAQGRTHEGSGIGLSLVQELIKLHGGSITAESVVDEGTTFIASLPLGSAHLPSDQIAEGRRTESAGIGAMPYVEEALRWLPDAIAVDIDPPMYSEPLPVPYLGNERDGDERPRVLVADDNADMRQYLVRLLAEHFRTEAVPDGEAALAAARVSVPDLILSDVMMPRLDGFGLLRALRADPRTGGVPVIMLSARAGEESRVEGMEAGADDYLVKPFGARELLARVRAHLQMARMRQEANASLREGEERLRMALTAARMVAWELDFATSAIVLSDNAADVFGLSPATQLARCEQVFALVHPDDVDHHRATVMKAAAECSSYISQFRLARDADEPTIWLEDRGHCIGDAAGKTVRIVGVVMDISARKRSEAEIQMRERQTRTILESITDGFFALDQEWRFTYMNAAGERFLNRAPGDWLGKCVWDEFPSVAGTDFERVYRSVASSGVAESFTAHYSDFDRWYEVSAYPAPDGLSVYFRDVTDKTRSDERLQASEDRRRLALDDAELGAWNIDLASRSTVTDSRFRAIFGTTEEWSDGQQIFGSAHPEDLPALRTAVDAATRLDNPLPLALEYRILHPDGSLHWVFAKGRSTIAGDGFSRRAMSFDGTVADITDRKLAEEEREYLVGQLQLQDRRKDEFLATLAHELRNPLAPISNGLQIIRLAGSTGIVEQARSMMDRQMTQMVRLVDDLLDISRITRGKLELRRQAVALRSVVEIAVEIASPLIQQAKHELTITVPEVPIIVNGDMTRLAQVLSNLLTNSAKYTHDGGHIHLTVERTGDTVLVAVRDNGIGIPAAMLGHVFEMFTQVDRTLEKTTGGLGIGLSLAKGLVEMHGGSLEARSDGEGLGSEFRLLLPVAVRDDGDLALLGGKHVPVAAAVSRRILVVDDNKDAADSLAQLLEMLGNEVRTANDGEAGITAAETFRPDVVLLDIGMPKMNGYDACRRIRAEEWGRDMLLVAMTGWGQAEDKRLAQDAGFEAHLVKPVDLESLQRLLATPTRDAVQ